MARGLTRNYLKSYIMFHAKLFWEQPSDFTMPNQAGEDFVVFCFKTPPAGNNGRRNGKAGGQSKHGHSAHSVFFKLLPILLRNKHGLGNLICLILNTIRSMNFQIIENGIL